MISTSQGWWVGEYVRGTAENYSEKRDIPIVVVPF